MKKVFEHKGITLIALVITILKNGNEIEKNNMVSGSLKSVLKNEEFLAYENKLYILDGC